MLSHHAQPELSLRSQMVPRGGISILGSKKLASRRNSIEFPNLGAPRSRGVGRVTEVFLDSLCSRQVIPDMALTEILRHRGNSFRYQRGADLS
jgi:hypothetical protein